jgi:hypothetical protein
MIPRNFLLRSHGNNDDQPGPARSHERRDAHKSFALSQKFGGAHFVTARSQGRRDTQGGGAQSHRASDTQSRATHGAQSSVAPEPQSV